MDKENESNLLQNQQKNYGSGGIRTHGIEMTGALNQRLRPLGHATHRKKVNYLYLLQLYF